MPSVAVIGAAGSAGQRHMAAFYREGLTVVPVEINTAWTPSAVEIISIATPDHLHANTVCQALDDRKAVFSEKPLAHDEFSLRRIERTVQQAGVTFSCNLPLRFSHKLRNIDLSDLTYMAGTYGWGRRSKMTGWRGDITDYSIVCGGGIHIVDLMLQRYNVAPTDIKATRNGQLLVATFRSGPLLCSLTVDFSYEGRHEVNVVLGSPRGHLPIWFDEPNDFQAPIRDFLQDWKDGKPGNGLQALAANRACLAIEGAAK